MWGLEVNSISVINMVMAVGFVQTHTLSHSIPRTKLRESLWCTRLVVDYSAHVIHNFGLQHQVLSPSPPLILSLFLSVSFPLSLFLSLTLSHLSLSLSVSLSLSLSLSVCLSLSLSLSLSRL